MTVMTIMLIFCFATQIYLQKNRNFVRCEYFDTRLILNMKKVILFTLMVAMGMVTVAQTTVRSLDIYDVDGHLINSVPFSAIQSIEFDEVNGYEYVDLGLSVLWATCNVGALSPEQYGEYYSWGEIKPKADYSVDGALSGIAMDDIAGTANDVAAIELRGSWRMPSKAEFEELAQCTWNVETINGITCYKVTGLNGNYIYLPCGGVHKKSVSTETMNYTIGRYWTSTPYASSANTAAYSAAFPHTDSSTGHISCTITNENRGTGRNIRPVISKDVVNQKDGFIWVEFTTDEVATDFYIGDLNQVTLESDGMTFHPIDGSENTVCAYDDIDFLSFEFDVEGGGTTGVEFVESPSDNMKVGYIEQTQSLDVESSSEIDVVVIYNAQGLLMKSVIVNENNVKISLADLPTGMYIVSVVCENVSKSCKIFKQ